MFVKLDICFMFDDFVNVCLYCMQHHKFKNMILEYWVCNKIRIILYLSISAILLVCFNVIGVYVPVNNFPVMSGRGLGFNQYSGE